MTITMLKGKIHRAVVTQAELNYVGSITVDPVLMEAAGIYEYEKVQVVDVESGSRLETYTIAGEPGKGTPGRPVRPAVPVGSVRHHAVEAAGPGTCGV